MNSTTFPLPSIATQCEDIYLESIQLPGLMHPSALMAVQLMIGRVDKDYAMRLGETMAEETAVQDNCSRLGNQVLEAAKLLYQAAHVPVEEAPALRGRAHALLRTMSFGLWTVRRPLVLKREQTAEAIQQGEAAWRGWFVEAVEREVTYAHEMFERDAMRGRFEKLAKKLGVPDEAALVLHHLWCCGTVSKDEVAQLQGFGVRRLIGIGVAPAKTLETRLLGAGLIESCDCGYQIALSDEAVAQMWPDLVQ